MHIKYAVEGEGMEHREYTNYRGQGAGVRVGAGVGAGARAGVGGGGLKA